MEARQKYYMGDRILPASLLPLKKKARLASPAFDPRVVFNWVLLPRGMTMGIGSPYSIASMYSSGE